MNKVKKLLHSIHHKLSDDELKILIEQLETVINGSIDKEIFLTTDVTFDKNKFSTAFFTLNLHFKKNIKNYLNISFPAEKARIIRDFISTQEYLKQLYYHAPNKNIEKYSDAAKNQDKHDTSIENSITNAYKLIVGRSPQADEIAAWNDNFINGIKLDEFYALLLSSDEAKQYEQRMTLLSSESDGIFVQKAYEIVLGRGAAAWEIDSYSSKLSAGELTRTQLLAILFDAANDISESQKNSIPHDGLSCWVMGTTTHVTSVDWIGQAKINQEKKSEKPKLPYYNRFDITGQPRLLVSAVASMFRAGEFIESFMENITSQDGFDDFCELIIVDADSPENEHRIIEKYLKKHSNINYIRCNYRLGIYDAWNVGVKAARGSYITNTNMDDLRRHDSLMLQAATLENMQFVDVVYQDLYYTFDPSLTYDEIAKFGLITNLPIISAHNLIHFNSPHNAPMWRKSLHQELGYFDTNFKSAGDYEFWMRCLAAKKKFFKINDPHVIYYQNPKGLSTRPGTRGVIESMEIHKKYCSKLVPKEVVLSGTDFQSLLGDSNDSLKNTTLKNKYQMVQNSLRKVARTQKYH